ncbi:DUF1254 domain-containing protein [Sphingomonas sp.]|uniref:DUF1254 domain-containing protein n=1 Tax=Sphingomonas sp. TaxID=28214 RepID=UPI00333FA80D
MARWTGPVLLGLLVAGATCYAGLVFTPDVLMGAAIRRVSEGGFGHFSHVPLADATSRRIVRPSPDLAYSSCPYDVSKAPLLIDAVPVAAPYWSLSIFDSRTDTVFVRNVGQAQGKPFRVAVARSGQPIPAGYEAVRVHGARGIALVRILVADRASFPTLDRARRATICRAG